MISLADWAISDFKLVIELLEVLHNTIRVYRSLYVNKCILYRDILKNNIIITNLKNANSFKSILINLDFAKEVSSECSSVHY